MRTIDISSTVSSRWLLREPRTLLLWPKITALAQPWRFFLLARMQKAFHELDETSREEEDAFMRDQDMESLLTLAIDRQVKRHDHLEVWG